MLSLVQFVEHMSALDGAEKQQTARISQELLAETSCITPCGYKIASYMATPFHPKLPETLKIPLSIVEAAPAAAEQWAQRLQIGEATSRAVSGPG